MNYKKEFFIGYVCLNKLNALELLSAGKLIYRMMNINNC